MLILFGAFLLLFSLIFAENITISCHISDDANHTHPTLGISHGMEGDLIACEDYLSICYVNDTELVKLHSQVECITEMGKTVSIA
jgi:hypothetical protein